MLTRLYSSSCWGKRRGVVSSNGRLRNGWRKSGRGSGRPIDGLDGQSEGPVVGIAGVRAKTHPDGGYLDVFLGRHSADGARAPEAPNAVRTAPARISSRTEHAFSLIGPRTSCRGIPLAGAAAVACRRAESGCRRRQMWIWMPPLRYARAGNGEFPENRKKQKRGTAHGKTRQYTA